MKIIFLADIVGKIGRKAIQHFIPILKKEHNADIIIANAENAAGGLGLDLKTCDEIFKSGVDIITSGNHIWSKKELKVYLESSRSLVRPANYPEGAPGKGFVVYEFSSGFKLGVANFIGRVFMSDLVDCPFKKADLLLSTELDKCDAVFVDFHAEASSEKVAFGYYLNGRASVVVGTHTHVQIADERILDKGTAYITDVGMCGPANGVIGCNKDLIIQKFITGRPTKFELASGLAVVNGVVVELDNTKNDNVCRAKSIKRIFEYSAHI